jgi:hypothetical protein
MKTGCVVMHAQQEQLHGHTALYHAHVQLCSSAYDGALSTRLSCEEPQRQAQASNPAYS